MTHHAEQAERRYLTARIADGTYRELADAYLAASRIRSRTIEHAAGNTDEDLSDLGNPFVLISEGARWHQHEIGALIELAKAIRLLVWVVVGGVVFVVSGVVFCSFFLLLAWSFV